MTIFGESAILSSIDAYKSIIVLVLYTLCLARIEIVTAVPLKIKSVLRYDAVSIGM